MKRPLLLLLLLSLVAISQRSPKKHTALSSSGTKLIESNKILKVEAKITTYEKGIYTYIKSNGIPNHKVGQFPNPGNPNTIKASSHEFRVLSKPKMNAKISKLEMAFDFGVAVNGVPFDPGAAEWYQGKRNSNWQYEALSGAVPLGVDTNHAHVQPTGAYHYHGLPTLLIEKLGIKSSLEGKKIGIAADGFDIYALYAQKNKLMKSSYKLKSGNRPIGGKYDGTFVQDYEYIANSGDLDECNGSIYKGKYVYFLTETFPVIPRCFRGSPDQSFKRGRTGTQMSAVQSQENRSGPPKVAFNACKKKNVNDKCSFEVRSNKRAGTCFKPDRGQLVCRPIRQRR